MDFNKITFETLAKSLLERAKKDNPSLDFSDVSFHYDEGLRKIVWHSKNKTILSILPSDLGRTEQ